MWLCCDSCFHHPSEGMGFGACVAGSAARDECGRGTMSGVEGHGMVDWEGRRDGGMEVDEGRRLLARDGFCGGEGSCEESGGEGKRKRRGVVSIFGRKLVGRGRRAGWTSRRGVGDEGRSVGRASIRGVEVSGRSVGCVVSRRKVGGVCVGGFGLEIVFGKLVWEEVFDIATSPSDCGRGGSGRSVGGSGR